MCLVITHSLSVWGVLYLLVCQSYDGFLRLLRGAQGERVESSKR